MRARRALIVGEDIAGSACAHRLLRSDWDVVLLCAGTASPTWGPPEVLTGAGTGAARRLGLLSALTERRQPRCHLVHVSTEGVPLAVTPLPSRQRLVLCPADVAEVLRGAAGDSVTLRDAEVSGVTQDDCGVTVRYTNGEDEWFDLVVDADAPSPSALRTPADRAVPTWSLMSSQIQVESACAVTMNDTGRSVRLHPLNDRNSAVSFAWRHNADTPWPDAFAGLGWIVPDLLSHVDRSETLSRRDITPAKPGRWAHGAIAILGGSAWHIGPYSGQMTSL